MSNLGRIQSRQRDACPAVRSQLSGMSWVDQRRLKQLLVAWLFVGCRAGAGSENQTPTIAMSSDPVPMLDFLIKNFPTSPLIITLGIPRVPVQWGGDEKDRS
jgi:hypothetical protein